MKVLCVALHKKLTEALASVEGLVDSLTAGAVSQTHATAVLHRVGIYPIIAPHLLQREIKHKHGYTPTDPHAQTLSH